MSQALFFLAIFLLLIVLFTLVAGVVTMTKTGKEQRKKSNKLMQLRVYLQGAVIVCLILSYLTK